MELGMISSTWLDTKVGRLDGIRTASPEYMKQVVAELTHLARQSSDISQRSGVSVRVSICNYENLLSSALKRAIRLDERLAVPRVSDLGALVASTTGKIELEYEGEMRGADTVVRDVIRTAVQRTFDGYFAEANTQQIEQWFNLGGTVQLSDAVAAEDSLKELQQIQGLFDKLKPLSLPNRASAEVLVSAAEFLLEGMTAHKRLSRTEERTFSAGERPQRRERAQAFFDDDVRESQEWNSRGRSRKGFN